MQSVKKSFIAVMVIAFAACTPTTPEDQSATNSQNPSTAPCIGTLCLGTDATSYMSNCAENISATDAINIYECPFQDQLSVAGATATSATLTIVEGKAARIMLWFDAESCPLVTSALYKSLGESTMYNFMQDSYRGVYASVSDKIKYPEYSMHDKQWQSANGQFVFTGNNTDLAVGGGCELRVDSLNMAREISRKISDEANNSIKG